jgi:hypothetical protein
LTLPSGTLGNLGSLEKFGMVRLAVDHSREILAVETFDLSKYLFRARKIDFMSQSGIWPQPEFETGNNHLLEDLRYIGSAKNSGLIFSKRSAKSRGRPDSEEKGPQNVRRNHTVFPLKCCWSFSHETM